MRYASTRIQQPSLRARTDVFYVKQQARHFFVNADHSRKINKQLSQHQSFITIFYSYLFLPWVIILIINMQP